MHKKKEWNIYFLLFDYVEVLDFTGSFDVFSMANISLQPDDPPSYDQGRVFKLHTVSQDGGRTTALHGLKIEADYSFETCPDDEIDVLIIPGASPTIIKDFIKKNPKVIEWVTQRLCHVEIVASVCVGALILAEAGGFDSALQATTHHGAIRDLEKILQKRGVKTQVIPGARYIDNPGSAQPRILSSAGVSAGIDQAFYMVRNILGIKTRDLELQPADIFFAPPDNTPPINEGLVNQVLADTTAVIMEYNETTNWVYGKFVSTNTE